MAAQMIAACMGRNSPWYMWHASTYSAIRSFSSSVLSALRNVSSKSDASSTSGISFVQKITPVGQRTLLIEDMRRQYAAFYAYYQYVFRTDNDFLYSLSMGPGGSPGCL